jgi:hypothetical protein
VGRSAFKKGSISRAVAMPLLFSHSSRLSIFQASRWGAPVLPSSCCCWRSTTSWGSALFSHRSASRIFIIQPSCSSPPVVTQNDDHQPCGGEERVGLWPPPCPQLQGCSSSVLGGEGKPSWGPAFRMGWRPASSSSIRGRRAFTSLAEEANCHLLPGRGVAVRPPHVRRSRRAQVGMSMALPAPPAILGGRTRRRTPQGRCPRSWMVLSSLP